MLRIYGRWYLQTDEKSDVMNWVDDIVEIAHQVRAMSSYYMHCMTSYVYGAGIQGHCVWLRGHTWNTEQDLPRLVAVMPLAQDVQSLMQLAVLQHLGHFDALELQLLCKWVYTVDSLTDLIAHQRQLEYVGACTSELVARLQDAQYLSN